MPKGVPNKRYTPEFKKLVVETMQKEKLSYRETARQLDISDHKRMAEKAELEAQLAIEENKKITLTEAQILAFLDYVCEMPADDVNKRRAIINIFVHSIYLYDDHFTLIINASKKPLSIDNIPLDDIETAFEGETGALEGCSSLSTPAPPNVVAPHPRRDDIFF